MKASEIVFNDYSDKVLDEMADAIFRALERCGQQAEGYAKDLCPYDTHTLQNSITHRVEMDEHAVYVGTNNEYAVYWELGTGRYYPGGRKGWWVYVKDSSSDKKGTGKIYTFEEAKQVMAILCSKGLDAHMTQGIEPQPFLKPAVADHAQTYRNIFDDELRNG